MKTKAFAFAIIAGFVTELVAALTTFTNTKIGHIAGLCHIPGAKLIDLLAGRMNAQGDSVPFGRLLALFMIQWALWTLIFYIFLRLTTQNKTKEA